MDGFGVGGGIDPQVLDESLASPGVTASAEAGRPSAAWAAISRRSAGSS